MSAPRIIPGPPSSEVSRERAEAGLKSHPAFPKNASFSLADINGQWVAAVVTSGPMPFAPDAESGPPKGPPKPGDDSDGPPTDSPSDDAAPDNSDGPPTDDEEDGPPKDDKGKGGDHKILEHLVELVTQLTTALGIAGTPQDNPAPGGDDGPPPPDPGAGPPPPSEDDHQTIKHERSLKPGEAPPGTTPVGAPSFSHVRDEHPWKKMAGVAATFHVASPIGDTPLGEVHQELSELAHEMGYEVKQLREGQNEDGERIAKALISAYK